jgi:hypothetical protein
LQAPKSSAIFASANSQRLQVFVDKGAETAATANENGILAEYMAVHGANQAPATQRLAHASSADLIHGREVDTVSFSLK